MVTLVARHAPGPDTPAPKVWTAGTHRIRPPAETVELVSRLREEVGITRVADVTGLDTVGIPVVMVVRPRARSVSVSQGKGVDRDAARASGLMESLELHAAEHAATPSRVGTAASLAAEGETVVDVARMDRPAQSRWHAQLELGWTAGTDLVAGHGQCWVPNDAVHLDLASPRGPGWGAVTISSNGLASGNCAAEAVLHGLCEVIERDAIARVALAGPAGWAARRIDAGTVDDQRCRALLDRFATAGVAVGLWDVTSAAGIPCVVATVQDHPPDPLRPIPRALGAGCHPAAEVATARALTEAAQCRLTVIAGSRDDHLPSGYERLRDPEAVAIWPDPSVPAASGRSWSRLPGRWSADLDRDVEFVLSRLVAGGYRQAVAVDLTPPSWPVSVVRVVVPGLLGRDPGAAPRRPEGGAR